MRVWLADLALRLAEWLTPPVTGANGAPRPFFDGGDDPMTDRQWAGLIVLHAEAVHGCEHTTQARMSIGMHGPRGRKADAA